MHARWPPAGASALNRAGVPLAACCAYTSILIRFLFSVVLLWMATLMPLEQPRLPDTILDVIGIEMAT